MKTKISDYYVDLTQVQAIGPLNANSDRHDSRRYGFVVHIKGNYGGSIWVNAVPDVLDPHSIDTSHNDAIKAKAKAAYDIFVAEWKAIS